MSGGTHPGTGKPKGWRIGNTGIPLRLRDRLGIMKTSPRLDMKISDLDDPDVASIAG